MKTKQHHVLPENKERIVGNNILPSYVTLDFL